MGDPIKDLEDIEEEALSTARGLIVGLCVSLFIWGALFLVWGLS